MLQSTHIHASQKHRSQAPTYESTGRFIHVHTLEGTHLDMGLQLNSSKKLQLINDADSQTLLHTRTCLIGEACRLENGGEHHREHDSEEREHEDRCGGYRSKMLQQTLKTKNDVFVIGLVALEAHRLVHRRMYLEWATDNTSKSFAFASFVSFASR